jgi:hypothetical protein
LSGFIVVAQPDGALNDKHAIAIAADTQTDFIRDMRNSY